MPIVVALLSGMFALAGVGLSNLQRRQDRRDRALEREEQRRSDALLRLEQLYAAVLKLCLDVRAGAFRQQGSAHPLDPQTFRTYRAQLMLLAPKAVEETFVRYLDRTNEIATQDPNDLLDEATQTLTVDWTPAEKALDELRTEMQLDLETARSETRASLDAGSTAGRNLPP